MLIATLRGVHPSDIPLTLPDTCLRISLTRPNPRLLNILFKLKLKSPDLLNVFRPHFQIQIQTSTSYILCLVDAVKCHCEYQLQFRASDTKGQQFISLTEESERSYHLRQPYCWQMWACPGIAKRNQKRWKQKNHHSK